jgi:hypothetical protein
MCRSVQYTWSFQSAVNLTLNVTLGFQEIEIPRIPRHSPHADGKVVSITHRPLYLSVYIPGTHSYKSVRRSQGNSAA